MMLTHIDYCQFLLSSPFNFTQTYFADHVEGLSHDRVNRLLNQLDLSETALWDTVSQTLKPSPNGYLVFDDTVLDKRYSKAIELVYSQWSGNAKSVINGIGVVTCVYVNPELDQFWAIDYRLYHPNQDGKKKTEHVEEMFLSALEEKALPVSTVLVDSWYAKREWLESIHNRGLTYYTVAKPNRLIAEHRGEHAFQRIDSLDWTAEELASGKPVRLNDFWHKATLYRVETLPGRIEHIVTNAKTPPNANGARQECRIRWKIEQFHRELKQLTGIEKCQCRQGHCPTQPYRLRHASLV